jgi:polyketide cyclase/dehydrase/lipid transport protein
MARYESRLRIPVPRTVVRAILLEPATLPEWNPAFRAITAGWRAQLGVRYPIAVRGGLTGYLEYTAAGTRYVNMRWRVPGLAETSTWQLIPYGTGTVVRHTFQHTGPLAALLRGVFHDVADLRLYRLAERAGTRLGTRNAVAAAWHRTGVMHVPAYGHPAGATYSGRGLP